MATNPADVDISPLLPPDPGTGKVVYLDNCVSCHGIDGMGDGERVNNLPSKPPPLGSLDYSRKSSPILWFQRITQGKMDKLMPGFGSSLSDRQRWDVTSYLLTMSIKPGQLGEGEDVYERTCQGCHGASAEGIADRGPALDGPDGLKKSLEDVITIIQTGKGSMPAIKDTLTEGQMLNTAAYLRSLLFTTRVEEVQFTAEPRQSLSVSPTEKPNTSQEVRDLNGRVVHGSGDDIPEDLIIELTGYSGSTVVYTNKTTIQKNGEFSFTGIPVQSDRVFQLSLQYKGLVYTSPIIHSGVEEDWQSQSIMIYEPSTSLETVKAERLHIFFEFPQAEVIRVVQLYVLSNSSRNIITAKIPGDPVVIYPLPAGAQNLRFQDGTSVNRFIRTQEGFGDTQGIQPGSGMQILYSYELPYSGDLLIPLKIALPVDTANIMLPSMGITVKSAQLKDQGEKIIQNSTWHILTSGALETNSRLNLLVTGRPQKLDPQEEEKNTGLAVGVISLAVVLIMVAVTIMQLLSLRKDQAKPAAAKSGLDQAARNAVLDAIIALDDQFQAGLIPPAAYRERRTELKERLRGE